MKSFFKFLQSTNAQYLYDFWIDCETFKDAADSMAQLESNDSINQLFRLVPNE